MCCSESLDPLQPIYSYYTVLCMFYVVGQKEKAETAPRAAVKHQALRFFLDSYCFCTCAGVITFRLCTVLESHVNHYYHFQYK